VIEKSIVLGCSLQEAFRLFTAEINAWWPPDRRHSSHPHAVIALVEDRFWESDPDGGTVELGMVRAWEPPRRIVLDWYPGTDRQHPTSGTRSEQRRPLRPAGAALRRLLGHRARSTISSCCSRLIIGNLNVTSFCARREGSRPRRSAMAKLNVKGKGTQKDPWQLQTPPRMAEYTEFRDLDSDPPALVVQVG
jgi:hypothetical protein